MRTQLSAAASSLAVALLLSAILNCTAQGSGAPQQPAGGAVPTAPPAQSGPPAVTGTTNLTTPPAAGIAIPIATTLVRSALTASLLWRRNYDPEQEVPFSGHASNLTAEIPGGLTRPGDMIRWAVQARLPDGSISRDPKFKDENSTQYYGTIIPNPQTAGTLPVLELFSPDQNSLVTQRGARCSIFFSGRFYDNVDCARKGVTSLAWPKPKLKVNFHKDNQFVFKNGLPVVDRIDLNSQFREPGNNCYMRETIGYALMKAAGSPTVNLQWVTVNLNGQYFGMFSALTKIDEQYLQQNGLRPSGGIYKALDGQNSNLRWDIPTKQLQFYYALEGAIKSKSPAVLNDTKPGAPYQILKAFLAGINGGGPGTRSQYAFDNLNVPAVINEMAVQTAMLNQDRCTKNYYLYHDETTREWQRLPYDLKSSFATDRGFNGQPAPDYCILACSQWNSPLYCADRQHAQDLSRTTPWAVITPQFGTFSGTAAGRRKLAAVAMPRPPNATIDIDMTARPSVAGANGTFNYLIKLVLDVPEMRAMYLRRLRSIMDEFLNGWVQQQFTNNYNIIAAAATKDNAKWNGGPPALGYKQMIEETLPLRRQQLYSRYGPGGPDPLIPATQDVDAVVTLGATGGTGGQAFLELLNPQPFAVDISGWKLRGAARFTFRPGTVISPTGSMFVSPNVAVFRARSTSPKGGEGRFVQGDASGDVTGPCTLMTSSGIAIPLVPAVASDSAAGGP